MSLEAFGDDGIGNDVTSEDLLDHGWECDPDCDFWWKSGEPETRYSFQAAALVFDESRWGED